ncbi:probable peptidoglycan muropeptide transporter SLC46 isoform X1 [Anabrus simplex]|uniref:probable peptidoglycan muropeptide transporter SLC46 isoform X1 n=1 Tax=Anabrus simplex TaxID=316456 RepID=UPI0034DD8156
MSEDRHAASSATGDHEVEWKNLSFREKARYMITHITVEPIGALYIMPSVLASLATQNLNLEKACYVNLKYGDEVCQALTARKTANYKAEETKVQQLVAGMIMWKTIVQSALPSILMLFLGSWSDRRGRRKPLMLMPIVGEFLTSIGLIFCTYFFYELPMEVAGVVEALFPALTGGWFIMFMAVYSYIGDITTVKMRTVRIGFVSLCNHIGVPIGMALSGILYVKIGFYGIFSIAAVLYTIIFCYTMFRIQEERKPLSVEEKKKREQQKCWRFHELVDLKHVAETFRVVFKNDKHDRRRRVIMLMVCCMVIIGPLHGEIAVMYLFTRYRFNWNEVDFSMFSTYSMITNLIGTMVSVGLFSHVLKIDDALIGVMSCTSKILSCFVYAFSTTDWMIYMAPIVEILNGTSFIAMRSIISKLVPPDELGKVNSLFGVCEALMPLVYGPMYSAVYAATMHTVPGAFFLLGGALTMPAVLMFFWMYMVHKREERRIAEEEKEQANDLAPIPNEKANGHIDTASYITADEKKQASESTPPEKPTGKVNEGYTQDPDETA